MSNNVPFLALAPQEPRIVSLIYVSAPGVCDDCSDCSDTTTDSSDISDGGEGVII